MVPELKHLGKKSPFIYDNPQPSILEWVPNAFGDPERNCHAVKGTVHIEAPEFTSLCPITGQPDFGTIVIDYEPHMRCVESKSLKLYLGAYRQLGEFQENIVNRIANAPEPPVQTIEDDQVCLIHRSRITLTISFLQVSLGPDDILFDDEGEPAHKSVPVEQDVTMTDISSAVSDFLFVKPY